MATPQPERSYGITPSTGKGLALTPGSRVLHTPLGDETIWKRLKDAGFDEESIRRRDKAALIAYIAKLEAEIFDHQHHMGLLILERKDLFSENEQMKTTAETADILYKRDQAARLSVLSEAKKREDNLKKAVGIKEECIASLEKALHEMRVESAETKVSAESKLAEARSMVDDAQKKFTEAEAKLHAAESLQAEATRYHRSAERKLHEVEAREDDLTRRIVSFKSDCDKKETELALERQSLGERRKALQQEQERLLDGQDSLNQREDYIFTRSQEIDRQGKELENSRASIEKERMQLNDDKLKLELAEASVSRREEAVIGLEALLSRKEQELLILQEKIATKESADIKKVAASQEIVLRTRKMEFDAELEKMQKVAEDEIEIKRRAWELREMDLKQREDLISEKEHDLEVQSKSLMSKEKEVVELSNILDEKEKKLRASEQEIELNKVLLQNEKEEYTKMKQDLGMSINTLENNKKQVDSDIEKLVAMKSETKELSNLEMRLKEEIDSIRAQKLEIRDEEDKLKVEKAKFEAEWELIDEKREELRAEVEHIAAERSAVSTFIKEERDRLRIEKDAMREQFKSDFEALTRDREEFMNKMTSERAEWLNKMQQERVDLILDVETQKEELENCLEQRREELESSLREKMERFEQEKKNELEYISSLKEKAAKDLEHVALEMSRLDTERKEINLDREKRNREWAEINDSIEELKIQREKLEKQRELLHKDREEILAQIEQLKKFEEMKIAVDNATAAEMHQSESTQMRKSSKKSFRRQPNTTTTDSNNQIDITNGLDHPSKLKSNGVEDDCSPSVTPFSWIKRCSEFIFKNSPEKPLTMNQGKLLITQSEDNENLAESPRMKHALEEPKVIVEVPSVEEDRKSYGSHFVEFKDKEDTNVSDQGIIAGRKRRIRNSISGDSVENMEQINHNKKQRKQKASATCSEENRVYVPEETAVIIVDKIIQTSEVIREKTEIGYSANEEGKLNADVNRLVESVEGIP